MQAERFYIGGEWLDPLGTERVECINPADGSVIGSAVLGNAADADRAVRAASAAFPEWSRSSVDQRVAVLERMRQAFAAIADEMADHLVHEIGLTAFLAKGQSMLTLSHFDYNLEILRSYEWATRPDPMVELVHEPIGVVAAITSWNAPVSQILCKAVPAIAAGCTVVVKPSERAPLCGTMLAEAMAKAGIPAGVFNLANGGAEFGRALAEHPLVDMISFTGSVPGGGAMAASAAPTIKRVHQELGGKSAMVLLDDCDFAEQVPKAVGACMMNAGQVCAAPTRLLVPQDRFDEVAALAAKAADAMVVGPPGDPESTFGPLSNASQFDRVREVIADAIAAGEPLLTGGPDVPAGLEGGFYVAPTVFGPVDPKSPLAQQEIFGPVLSILTFTDDDDAVQVANDSMFGLAGYVESASFQRAHAVARQIRAGYVRINSPGWTNNAPFGGYRQSGNGKQYGVWGFEEFLETKALVFDPETHSGEDGQ